MIDVLIEGMTSGTGGKETYIMNMYDSFDRTEYRFTFVAYEDRIAYEDKITGSGSEVIHLPSRDKGLFRFRKALDELFEKRHFDVVWAHKTTLSSCEILEIAKKHKVPLRIVHSHSSSNMGGKLTFVLHTLNKCIIRRLANEYFACSEPAAKWFFGSGSCEYIRNGINIDRFRFDPGTRERIRRELSLGDRFTIGHVGRFGAEKNHAKLIKVFAEVRKLDGNARLVLCGDGEERANIERLIDDLGLKDSVLLLGKVGNVNEILRAVDMIVMPSLFEGLPFALLEAQAAGLRCIVSDTVSRESDITGWNEFIGLDCDDSVWAERIVNAYRSDDTDRRRGAEILREKGYDVAECADKVRKIIASHLL